MAASRVASGIFISRILGFARDRTFGHFFGLGLLADAWGVALKVPNVIQNLLGEGSLSASFIPVYVRLHEEGRKREAGLVAGAVLGLLSAVAGSMALVGSLSAPWLVRVLASEFGPEKAALTTELLRIVFPMTAVLVISAWALGVLNSHRRFFVSYVAPALWNLAMIAVLVVLGNGLFGGKLEERELMVALAWGALAGGVAQLLFQLAFAARYLKRAWPSLRYRISEVREVITNFVPLATARGAVNLSALLDLVLASLLIEGAVGLARISQTVALLPISLFGIAIAAAELPELSRDRQAGLDAVRDRSQAAVKAVLFLIVPAAVAYLVFGDVVMGAIYTTGEFTSDYAVAAGVVLAAFALGLPASATSRVLSSTFFSLGDTRTPARIAYLRILVSAAVGAALMFPMDKLTLGGLALGVAGLAAGSAVGAWLELWLMTKKAKMKIPGISLGGGHLPRLLVAAGAATSVGLTCKVLLPPLHPIGLGLAVLVPFGVTYQLVAERLAVSTVSLRELLAHLTRRKREG